jgi:hypothetical protein
MSSTRFLDRPAAKGAMQVRLISPEGPELRHVDELDQLLAGPDLVWVDVPSWDDEAAQVLGKLLRLHPRAMQGLRVAVFGTGTDAGLLVDSEDQFRRIGAMADSRREYCKA